MPEKPKLDDDKLKLVETLTRELPDLRKSTGISKTEFAKTIGLSRQIYYLVETGKRSMTWSMFAAAFLYFEAHSASKRILESMNDFEKKAYDALNMTMRESGDVCPYCNSRNPHGVNYCGECGAEINGTAAKLCGGCGAAIRSDVNYCGQCGEKV